MNSFQIEKIEKAFVWLQNEFETNGEVKPMDVLSMQLDQINSVLSWAYEQHAIAKRLLRESISKAYETFVLSYSAAGKQIPPSIAKDYVTNKVSETAYNNDISERLCRSLVHIGDNLRTQISALKEQMRLEYSTSTAPRF